MFRWLNGRRVTEDEPVYSLILLSPLSISFVFIEIPLKQVKLATPPSFYFIRTNIVNKLLKTAIPKLGHIYSHYKISHYYPNIDTKKSLMISLGGGIIVIIVISNRSLY